MTYSITTKATKTVTEVLDISMLQFPNTLIYGLVRKVRIWYSKRKKKVLMRVSHPDRIIGLLTKEGFVPNPYEEL